MNRTKGRVAWAHIWRAESVKLFSRAGTRLALVVSAILGVAGPLTLWLFANSGMIINGVPLHESLTLTAPMSSQWALEMRNFFIFRVLLIMIGALSFAGEFQSRTLRDDLLRPVSRSQVLLAKWAALLTFIVTATAVTWLLSATFGLLLFGHTGYWRPIALGYLATALTDAGFAALVLTISVLLRSVAGTVAGVLLFLILDTLLGWGLILLSWVGQLAELPAALELAVQIRPWLPSAAFGAWSGFAARADWAWQSFVALGLLTLLSWIIADRALARMDVP